MANLQLVELDSLEVIAIVDNELDPISPCPNPALQQTGGLRTMGMTSKRLTPDERGGAVGELRMDQICCGAHGLSLLVTGVQGDRKHSILFDTGPEEDVWERNATRLRAPIQSVEAIQLSHWHRDHSGGMLKALRMIHEAREAAGIEKASITVDLHPDRPDFRGMRPPGMPPISLEADPSFEEITQAGGMVAMHDEPHTLLDDMFLVSGEIPRLTAYEKGLLFGVRHQLSTGVWESDELMKDERFLMCKVKGKGIVVFTGCSHAGVVNASRHAVKLGNGTPLYAVVGGYHLADAMPEVIQTTAADLKTLDIKMLLAGHCTGWRAKFELQRQMPGCLVPSFVGTTSSF